MDDKKEIRWSQYPGENLLKNVTMTWEQMTYFCSGCNRYIGISKPENFQCNFQLCKSQTYYESIVPQEHNVYNDKDINNFWNAFRTPNPFTTKN